MSSVLAYATSFVAASCAFLAYGAVDAPSRAETEQDVEIQFDSNLDSQIDRNAEETDDEFLFDSEDEFEFDENEYDALPELFADFNRIAREEDEEALYLFYATNRRSGALTPTIVRFFAESVCAALLDRLSMDDDGDVNELYKIAIEGRVCSERTFCEGFFALIDQIAIVDPEFAQKQRKVFRVMIEEAPYVPKFTEKFPKLDPAFYNVESGRDQEYYRELLDKLNAEYAKRNGDVYGRSFIAMSDPEFQDARAQILRKLVSARGDKASPQFQKDVEAYANELASYNPYLILSRSLDATTDARRVDFDFIVDAFNELKEKGLYNEEVEELERIIYLNYSNASFTAALESAEQKYCDGFIDFYRDALAKFPNLAVNAEGFVDQARDQKQTTFAERIVETLEEQVRKNAADDELKSQLLSARNALNATRFDESIVGKELAFSGIDVNFQETSDKIYRGKYLIVLYRPIFAYQNEIVKRFANVVQGFDSSKVAVLEYAESLYNADDIDDLEARNLDDEKVKAAVDKLKSRPWRVVVQELSDRANQTSDAKYSNFFPHSYECDLSNTPRYALVDPNGVVLSVDSVLWRLQRRLQILLEKDAQNQGLQK